MLTPPPARFSHVVEVVDHLIEHTALARDALGALKAGPHIAGVAAAESALLKLLAAAAPIAKGALIAKGVLRERRAVRIGADRTVPAKTVIAAAKRIVAAHGGAAHAHSPAIAIAAAIPVAHAALTA